MPIEFIAANCPNCGGELRVPKDRDKVKCMYCGHNVLIHDSNKLNVNMVMKVDTGNIIKLARIAEKAKNYPDAQKYYTQVVESNAENITAWLGRARCTARVAGLDGQKLKESISYIKTALTIGQPPESRLHRTILSLIRSTAIYYRNVVDQLSSQYLGNKTVITEIFEEEYYPTIYKTLKYCWSVDSSEKAAEAIIDLMGHLQLEKNINMGDYGKLIENIEQKYPDKKRERTKFCYIATASMGSTNHPYVETLRQFRDHFLSKTTMGRMFIVFYYRYSPLLAKIIEKYPMLQQISRILIVEPAYRIAKRKIQNSC